MECIFSSTGSFRSWVKWITRKETVPYMLTSLMSEERSMRHCTTRGEARRAAVWRIVSPESLRACKSAWNSFTQRWSTWIWRSWLSLSWHVSQWPDILRYLPGILVPTPQPVLNMQIQRNYYCLWWKDWHCDWEEVGTIGNCAPMQRREMGSNRRRLERLVRRPFWETSQ